MKQGESKAPEKATVSKTVGFRAMISAQALAKEAHKKNDESLLKDKVAPKSFAMKAAATKTMHLSSFLGKTPAELISAPKKPYEDLVPQEMATEIIQGYLLPLFERKGLAFSRLAVSEKSIGFLNEMRLSDQLLSELEKTNKESVEILANFKKCEKYIAQLKQEVTDLAHTSEDVNLELKMLQFQESNVRVESRTKERRCAELRSKLDQQMAELVVQKDVNFCLSKKLFEEERKVEHLSQVVAQNQNASSLSKLNNDVLAEQVKNLHGAVTSLSDLDSLQGKIVSNRERFTEWLNEDHTKKEYAEVSLARIADERNHIDSAKRELVTNEQWLLMEQTRLTNELEEQKNRGQADLMALFDEKEQLRKERDKLDKKLKDVSENRDKLKQKMKKYRARRARFDAEAKTCKKCGKEYSESDNFNWSCRTHQSDFGGEMWWCCGKLGKDAIGCKFNKHESKEDEDDLDEQERKEKVEHDTILRNLSVRCYSCSEVGHKSRDCVRDPNLRTHYPTQKELTRVGQLALASRKLVRLMRGKEVAAMVNAKFGYDVLGDAANEEMIDQPFDSLVEYAWGVHMRRWKAEGILENRTSLMPRGALPDSVESEAEEGSADEEFEYSEFGSVESGDESSGRSQDGEEDGAEDEEPDIDIARIASAEMTNPHVAVTPATDAIV